MEATIEAATTINSTSPHTGNLASTSCATNPDDYNSFDDCMDEEVATPLLSSQQPFIAVPKETDPYNEFEVNDALLYGSFPHLFLFGSGLLQSGSVPTKAVRHLMFQFHNRFASCLRLIFLLFDQLQRHETARSVAARVKGNPKSISEFAHWVADPTFIEELRDALSRPNDPSTLVLIKKIMPHVAVCSATVPYTSAQRKAAMSKLYAMTEFFGPPSLFFTFVLDDINGVLNLRMSMEHQSNWSTKIDGEQLLTAMKAGKHRYKIIDLKQSSLRTYLAAGPVGAAEMFRIMVQNVFTILLGTPPESDTRRDKPLAERMNGINGTPIASFGSSEEQGRGSLHMHIITWCGLPPTLIQAAGGLDNLSHIIAASMERVVCGQLDPITHVKHLIRDYEGQKCPHPCLFKLSIATVW